MKFLIEERGSRRRPSSFPSVVLRRDRWDDYGFQTLFNAAVHLKSGKVIELEGVKILQAGQTGGRTTFPGHTFSELAHTDYCSLGQSYSYYERLFELGEAIYKPVLEGLSDVVLLPDVLEAFKDSDGFRESLTRFDGAEIALQDAALLFTGGNVGLPPPATLQFAYRFPASSTAITFSAIGDERIPGRITALIGYNGAGKTRLLSNLARLACADRVEARKEEFVDEVGEFISERPQFGSVLTVSYSAFDEFVIPKAGGNRAATRNYVYLGLRRVEDDADQEAATETSQEVTLSRATALKDFAEIANEFHAARRRATEDDRRELLARATDLLFMEPSFATTSALPDIFAEDDLWWGPFAELSAGHKIVLNIVVSLCAFIQPRSLVLFDEPELHLHPPLVAALLRAVGVALDRYDGFSIVATHSPVVLQEVQARNVRILRRHFNELRVEEPDSETFAENIGLLTRTVFSLDSSATDYEGVVDQLTDELSLDEIEALFPHGLSSQGRALVSALLHRKSGGASHSHD